MGKPDSRWPHVYYAALMVFTILSYWLLGHFLFITYRVPVGNTGVYAEGLVTLVHHHWGGFDSFVGTAIYADAGEFIAYLLIPVYGLLGMAGLWWTWGAAIGVSAILADRLAIRSRLTVGARVVIALAIVANGFILTNFLTSWDFDVLFIPGILGLALMMQDETSLWYILPTTLLTALIKDEAGIFLFGWALIEAVIHRNGRARWLMVGVVGLAAFAAGHTLIKYFWPGTPSQIGLHYAAIGGTGGLSGVIRYLAFRPATIPMALILHWHYVLQVVASSGGAMLTGPEAIPAWLVTIVNGLGSGGLGALMWHANFEFTLMVVPFAVLALLDALKRWPRVVPILGGVLMVFTAVYIVQFSPSFVPSMPPSAIADWNSMVAWYRRQPRKPVVYAQNETAAHFLSGAPTGVGVDSLRSIADLAARDHRHLILAYDPRVQNDGDPLRWPTRLAALEAAGDLSPMGGLSHGDLHVYRVRVLRLLDQSRTMSTILPTRLQIEPWMWIGETLALQLAPGRYRVTSGKLVGAAGGTYAGGILTVSTGEYVRNVVLTGHGALTLVVMAPH